MTGTGKSQSSKLLQNILASAKTFSHCTGNFFCPGEEMGDISQGYTMLHVLQLNCQLSPQDRAVIGSVHTRFPLTPICEHKGWDVAKARKCTAKHSWHEWQNKQKQMSLHMVMWGRWEQSMFWQEQKKKLVSEQRRLCRQRKVLSVIISEVAFADHKIATVRKQLLWVPNPHNRPNKSQKHDVHVQGFQWNTAALGLANPDPFTNLLDGSKFSTTLPHTVYFQMQQVFYQTKWKQCKKWNMI